MQGFGFGYVSERFGLMVFVFQRLMALVDFGFFQEY